MKLKNLIACFFLGFIMVSCIQDEAPNAEADIIACSVPGDVLNRDPIIENNKVTLIVKAGTDITALAPKFTLTPGASIIPNSGIALSDRVTGPYTFLKAVRPNAGSWPINVLPIHKTTRRPSAEEERQCTGGSLPAHPDSLNILGRDMEQGQMARDMNLFVDDDGKAYHIYSSEENSTLHIAELDPSYTGYTGKYIRVFINRFMEAPAMFKKDGNYYLIMSGCSGWNPNAARSAIASSIFCLQKSLHNIEV
jgi:hypothetical protein